MKKLAIAATISAGLLVSGCSTGSNDVVVESEAGDITKDEFYNEMKNSVGDQVLQQMMLEKVLESQYDIDDKEVDKQVKEMKDELGEQFEMALQQQGIQNEEQLKDQLRVGLLYDKAMFGEIDITEKELKEQYERMKTEIKASHILVSDEEEAKDIKKKLDDGADFAKLAKKHSSDGSSENGGDLGWFTTGQMVPEFENTAFDMKKGEISEPVQSEFGYHVIMLEDKRDVKQDIGSFEDNKDMIETELKNKQVDTDAKLKELLENAEIEVKDDQFKGLFDVDETEEAQG